MQPEFLLPLRTDGGDTEAVRAQTRHYFLDAFHRFESLFSLLKDDSVFYLRSEPTRQPMIFYYGHTAVFYVNKLILAQVADHRIDPHFESIFAIGVDEMAWDDMEDQRKAWPDVDAVRDYRMQVKQMVLALIDTVPLSLPITQSSPWWVILMGIEHERIHIETSSVLHRQMALNAVKSSETVPDPCMNADAAPDNTLVAIPGGSVSLGRDSDAPFFGWDNEYGNRREEVASFKTARMLTSHGEFLAFVESGGYEEPEWWNDEGKAFLKRSGATHPPFWVRRDDGGWNLRLLDREIDLPMNWPVEVNCLEAEAFCRYKSAQEGVDFRLPSEAEWYRILAWTGMEKRGYFDPANANVNFAHFGSSVPVDCFRHGDLFDVVGNVWQWTSTPIGGFEGFAPHPAYDDFSLPTFDGKHNVIKGGSWASTGNEITVHSRYAFRRHFYQHAGFRYVQGVKHMDTKENVYETDTLVAQYCEFQYGEPCLGAKNFAEACAKYAIDFSTDTPQKRALDLGCATGRASFELARVFEEVTGIDFSARFIRVGLQMQSEGSIAYERLEEGKITSRQHHSLKALDLEEVAQRVTFWQGDACNLKARFEGYDLILATNLIDRLYDPGLFLDTVHERLNEGGILVLTSPYTWLEEYTEKEKWIGGYYDNNGNPVFCIEALRQQLSGHFELMDALDVPFVIRETARKHQHTLAQMSAWRKQ